MAKVLNVYRGDGLNLYAYVKNNPVMWVDPTGYKTYSTDLNMYFELFDGKVSAENMNALKNAVQAGAFISSEQLSEITRKAMEVWSNC